MILSKRVKNLTKIKFKFINLISYISNTYSKTINKYLKSYDPKQESKLIIYLDTNNLCGYAMSKSLPARGLKLRYPKDFNLNKYTINGSKECNYFMVIF